MNLDKYINKIKNLPQYKGKSEKEIQEIALKQMRDRELEVENQFKNKTEQKRAVELYNKYLEDYSIETISDINLLKQLVYIEILGLRLQNALNKYEKEAPPLHLIEDLHKNLDKILILKRELGLSGENEKQTEAYKALETLKKRFNKYINEHKDEFTMVCPHCGKLTLIKRRVKGFDQIKHPFFKGRTLYNKKVLSLIKEGKITIKDASEILETSEEYIRWLLDKSE